MGDQMDFLVGKGAVKNHADIRDGQEVFGRPPTRSGRFYAA